MSITTIGNWAVFIIYIITLFKAFHIFLNAYKANLNGCAQTILYAFSSCLILQSFSFIILQVEWILEDNNESITDVASWGWMFYDYFNGFTLLCFTIALDIFINWHVDGRIHDRRKED